MEGAGHGEREASEAQGDRKGPVGDEAGENPKDLRQPFRFFFFFCFFFPFFIIYVFWGYVFLDLKGL